MNITISIPYEVNQKLSKIDNKSGLITNLLRNHFLIEENNTEILKLKREDMKTQMENNIRELNYKIELIEKEREKEVKTIEKTKEQIEKKINLIIKNAKDIFEKEITKEQAQEYLDSDKWSSLGEYIDENL